MELEHSSETLVTICQTTRRHNPEDTTLQVCGTFGYVTENLLAHSMSVSFGRVAWNYRRSPCACPVTCACVESRRTMARSTGSVVAGRVTQYNHGPVTIHKSGQREAWFVDSWDGKIWPWVPRDSETRMTALARATSNLPNQIHYAFCSERASLRIQTVDMYISPSPIPEFTLFI
jgi:hypothetical protein